MVPGSEAALSLGVVNLKRKHFLNICFPFFVLAISGCAPRSAPHHDAQTPSPKPHQPPRVAFALCDDGLPIKDMWKCDPVLQDINSDGILDLAGVARKGDGPHIWRGDGHGRWLESSSGLTTGATSCGGGLSLSDLNADGILDMVQADHCHGVSVFLGDASGKWNLVVSGLYPKDLVTKEADDKMFVGAEDVDVGDVNGDGFPDFVTGATDQGGVAVFLGDGTGKNWTHMPSSLPTAGSANRVMFADIDRDGKLDIVASYAPGPRVWRGDGRGGWTDMSRGLPFPTVLGLYRGLAVGDVNEDGRLDIAVANWIDGPEVYLQQEDGSWTKTPDVFPELRGGAVGLAMGDVDGDGHLDMVVSGRLTQEVGYVYGVFMLIGDGRGGWTWSQGNGLIDAGLAFTWGVALGDVNGDGLLDVAAGSGGLVATVPGLTEPVIPVRLPVWCSRRAEQAPPKETR